MPEFALGVAPSSKCAETTSSNTATSDVRALNFCGAHNSLTELRGSRLLSFARSVLEAVLAMPFQEMRMGALKRAAGRKRAGGFVDEGPNAFWVIDLPRNHNFELVRQADQPTIEHPVRCGGEGDPIADDIRPVRFDRSDMRSGDSARPPPLMSLSPVMAQRAS